MRAMETFLDDYELGKRNGRYIDAGLPALPFADNSFDLALCSHFLFLYSDQLSKQFHLQSIHEMCRIAREVRIFPLLALDNRPSPHLPESLAQLNPLFESSIEKVPYEFQRGGNRMLRIRASCK
jgi:ubiquinone/menaquinone biosynthesis C-methylase UbiE